MHICFPVGRNEGMGSEVYGHFGSAPFFAIVDTETDGISVIDNGDRHHAHGACNPLKALDGRRIDAVIVGGIGGGALSNLRASGVKVYRAKSTDIRENISQLSAGGLQEFGLQGVCGGHSHGGACAH